MPPPVTKGRGWTGRLELKPIKGIEIVGPLPPEVQLYTVFSAGVVADSREPAAARALVHFLASPAAADAIRASGMEPMGAAVPARVPAVAE